MSHGASGTNGMAFSNNPRSFTNIGIAATNENKSSGPSLNPTYGTASKGWGSSNIWSSGNFSNGLGSRATTRDNSGSRDLGGQPARSEAKTIEGKTGSGSLVDSSVSDDWNSRTQQSGKRSFPSEQLASQGQHPKTSMFQPRGVSIAGLPGSLSNTVQNPSSLAPRQPIVNLSSQSPAQSISTFGSTHSGRYSGRECEQPMKVYTKQDHQQTGPNSRRVPDSAKEGSWGEYSPTDVRKPAFTAQTGSRTASTPVSRDGGLPFSHSRDEQPIFAPLDWSRASQIPTQDSSRAPSVSSLGNGFHNSLMNPSPDQLAMRLSQLHANSDHRPPTSHKISAAPSTMFNQPSPPPGTSPRGHPTFGGACFREDYTEDGEEFNRVGVNYLAFDGYGSSQQTPAFQNFAHAGYLERPLHKPIARSVGQGRTYANGIATARPFDIPTGPGSGTYWPVTSESVVSSTRKSPTLQEQSQLLDPRVQQMLASQLHAQYGPLYNPYALSNTLQLGTTAPHVPLLPMNLPSFEPTTDTRDASTTVGDGMQSALMYEFKSNTKSRRYELKDIYDHIAEFSGDQHGSRFIQTKLETANSDEKERVFSEIQPNAIQLMTDVFGNYVIQKFFEHGDQMHKRILANKMKGQVLTLSLQMYGCRVVQKALDHVLDIQQRDLVLELDNHILRCVKDQNGNHVIQKAIERCPPDTVELIIGAFRGQVQHLSIHPYGCRVIQRCLERCDPISKAVVMSELMDGIQSMIADQYGNYVVQHVVQHDNGQGRKRVLDIVGRGLETYSKHKFASNVVEKCLEKADDDWRRRVVYAIANGSPHRSEGEGGFVGMIKDSYGNYVIQKLLDTLSADDYSHFLELLHPAMAQAKRTGCGKQVLSIEKKMHRFPAFRNGPANVGAYNTCVYLPPLPPPTFNSNIHSAATTPPPPLTADTQSLQSSAIPSINGDAVEGAAVGSRKGSELSNDGYFR